MTGPAVDCKGARLECWSVAGIAAARADRSKTSRDVGMQTLAKRQMLTQTDKIRRARAPMASATCICRGRARSTIAGARLKSP